MLTGVDFSFLIFFFFGVVLKGNRGELGSHVELFSFLFFRFLCFLFFGVCFLSVLIKCRSTEYRWRI